MWMIPSFGTNGVLTPAPANGAGPGRGLATQYEPPEADEKTLGRDPDRAWHAFMAIRANPANLLPENRHV
ncbi:hypothetical protein SAMN04488094_11553 [Tropicimonas isoalkanivorans]|uniref:Uncharacterized protein n=1 Tax=Tropicimonas isoalkanivorans TaxID=441112 RepID=A0A1I1PVC0_9RHOB|nr:hypothetical protein SAMN04488094_11553 [Tropicimonas isoalkanivorans]